MNLEGMDIEAWKKGEGIRPLIPAVPKYKKRDYVSLTFPFYMEWRIENLGHWTREVHGDSIATTIDFKSGRVDFTVYPQCADGSMQVHYPEEFGESTGYLTIKGGLDGGRVLSEIRKEPGQRVLHGPEFEIFRRTLGEALNHLVFRFVLDDVKCVTKIKFPTTVLKLDASDDDGQGVNAHGSLTVHRSQLMRGVIHSAPVYRFRDPYVDGQGMSHWRSSLTSADVYKFLDE